MKPKRWRWRDNENHSQSGGGGQNRQNQKNHASEDGALSNGTSSPNSHRTSNTNTKTQHIKGKAVYRGSQLIRTTFWDKA